MIEREELERLFREANDRAEAEEFEKAIGVYREVLTLAGDHDPLASECAHWGIGEVSFSLGDYRTAAGSMLSALALNPQEAAYHYLLGMVFMRMGASVHALTAFSVAHELEPNKPKVLRSYGWALHQNGEIERGCAMLRTALALNPNDHRTLTKLGWAYALQGSYGESLVCLERAREIAPWNMETALALSTVERFGADAVGLDLPIPATGPTLHAQDDDWDDDEEQEGSKEGEADKEEEDEDEWAEEDDWEEDEDWEDDEDDEKKWEDSENVQEDDFGDDNLIDIG
jgi:tetratricopeptide (TPR) repeat protein